MYAWKQTSGRFYVSQFVELSTIWSNIFLDNQISNDTLDHTVSSFRQLGRQFGLTLILRLEFGHDIFNQVIKCALSNSFIFRTEKSLFNFLAVLLLNGLLQIFVQSKQLNGALSFVDRCSKLCKFQCNLSNRSVCELKCCSHIGFTHFFRIRFHHGNRILVTSNHQVEV